MAEELFFEFGEVYPLASNKAKRIAGMAVKFGLVVEPGAKTNKASVEAGLLLKYLHMCPIVGNVEELETQQGRVLIADLYYEGAPILQMFCE